MKITMHVRRGTLGGPVEMLDLGVMDGTQFTDAVALNTSLPILPNPLIPTFTAIFTSSICELKVQALSEHARGSLG